MAGVLSVAILGLLLPLRREPGRGDGFELAGDDLLGDDALIGAATDGFETRRGEGTARDDVSGGIDAANVRNGGQDDVVVGDHQGNECGALDACLPKYFRIRSAAGNHAYPPCSRAIACLRVQFNHNEIYLAAAEKFDERTAGQSVAGYDNIGS
jgi:hypothetical protein